MLVSAKQLYPGEFAWRADNWIDKLSGSERLRTAVDSGADTETVIAGWRDDLAAFALLRAGYLLYAD